VSLYKKAIRDVTTNIRDKTDSEPQVHMDLAMDAAIAV
jgi:hypothetical protein